MSCWTAAAESSFEPGDIGRALDEMKRVGAVLLERSDL
jgi:hypothetical protein